MKEGRKLEYPEKTPGDELQKMPHVSHESVCIKITLLLARFSPSKLSVLSQLKKLGKVCKQGLGASGKYCMKHMVKLVAELLSRGQRCH